ncbi:unnamed protein product [Bemisia tabaci]|uniref:Galectin n=1 Tax=Bemisia tabaci TaxID=7038 RepID=A0A9P0ACX7_BEMTA|nr:unnamed protein product [Bemisia tabaci]
MEVNNTERWIPVPILIIHKDFKSEELLTCERTVFVHPNEHNSYQQLLNFIRSFPETAKYTEDDYTISYFDTDNDQIPVQSETEFAEYLKVCPLPHLSEGKVRPLVIHDKGLPKDRIDFCFNDSPQPMKASHKHKLSIEHAASINIGSAFTNMSLNENSGEISDDNLVNSGGAPLWFSREMDKFKADIMKNMSTHLESFTKEFHLALEKAIRGDEPKKLKKNKEKRRCEKKEKTKLLGSASTSKTMKDKQTKINETLKAHNMTHPKSFDNESLCLDYIAQSQKRMNLNEEKKTKLHSVAKRKKESLSKYDNRSPFSAKENQALFDFSSGWAINETLTNSKKKDTERLKTKCSDLSQSSSDSDNRDGQEESDDIVIVGFNSSFDEISDTDLSFVNGEELAKEMPTDGKAVDVELPPCFFPEIPVTFKDNIPLQLKQNDLKGLKSTIPNSRAFPFNKKSRSKDKKHDENVSMADEEDIHHSSKDKKQSDKSKKYWRELEEKFKTLQNSCKNEEDRWKVLEAELIGWQLINHSLDPANGKKTVKETDRKNLLNDSSCIMDNNVNPKISEAHKALSALKEALNETKQPKKVRNSVENPFNSGHQLKPVASSSVASSSTDEKLDENNDGSKANADQRSENVGTKMTVSEMLLSREPPHSDVLKERKRKKEPDLETLMDMMLRICKNPAKERHSLKKDTNEGQTQTGVKVNSNAPHPKGKSSAGEKSTSNGCTKLEEQFLLKSLNSSDDDSSSDYEECEETGKSSGKTHVEIAHEPTSATHSVEEESKTEEMPPKLGKETSFASSINTVEDPLHKGISCLTAPNKTNCSQDSRGNLKTAAPVEPVNKANMSKWNDLVSSSTRASQTSNSGLSNESSKILFSCGTSPFGASQGVAKENTSTGIDSANLSFLNTNKNVMYPPQQIHPGGGALNNSSSYAFGGAPYYLDFLNPSGYQYVPHMPLPKNFSCSQSFQSSHSAQNLIPKPTLAPPPPPIVIPPPIPQEKHFYFQPGYNALYTNPYYTNPQLNAFLSKGDPMKNCSALKRDLTGTYTTPVMGYPSVYPSCYPPSNVPLNTSHNNLTAVVPPVPNPVINFPNSSQPVLGQPSVSESKNLTQIPVPGNSQVASNVSGSFALSLPHNVAAMTKATDPVDEGMSMTDYVAKNNRNKTLQQNQSVVPDLSSTTPEASAPSAPCGIEVSSPERSPKPPPRLNITGLIPERLLTTLNSAATNVKGVFAPSRAGKKDSFGAHSSQILPEFLSAFIKKEPIQVHIITRSSFQRYFVIPVSKLGESHSFHSELRAYMSSEGWQNVSPLNLQSGDICALHENIQEAKEGKDSFSRVKILSVDDAAGFPGTLIRAQKIDFGVIVHCERRNLKVLPTKFQFMPPLVAEVVFGDQEGAASSLPTPLFIQLVRHFPKTNHWSVKMSKRQNVMICDNSPDETHLDEELEDGSCYEIFGVKGKKTPVPKLLPLSKGFLPGSKLILRGAPSENNPNRFAINLNCGSQEDIALHLNPRLKEGVFVRNTRHCGWWGIEERDGPFLFTPGVEFILQIECQSEGYNIKLNKVPLLYYKHRTNPEGITQLKIEGDVTIYELIYAAPNVSDAAFATQDSTLESTPSSNPPALEDAVADERADTSEIEQPEQSLQDKINFLLDIGFKDEEKLKNLLMQNNEDMSDVVDILTNSSGYSFSSLSSLLP